MKFCFNCGTKIEPGIKFCPECGQKLAAATPAPQPAPAPVYAEPAPAPQPAPAPAPQPAPAPVYAEPAPAPQPAPAPVYAEPAPAPQPAPAPVYAEPAPAPQPAPAPVYAEPAPAPQPAPAPVYAEPAPAPQPAPAPVCAEPAPAPQPAPAPVYAEPAPAPQPAPAPVYAEPAPAFSAPVAAPAQTGPVVYGTPVANTFSAATQTDVQQGVVHTYGAPVQHSFSAPVQAETTQSGSYAIPVKAEPVAAAPKKSPKIAIPTMPKKEKAEGEAKSAMPPQVGELLGKGTEAVKNLGAKAQELAGNVDVKGLAGNKFVRIGLVAVLVLVLAITLFSCIGGKKDPNAGLYNVISCTYEGVGVEFDDDWIELKKNGKAEIRLMGTDYKGKWELDEEDLTLTQDGDVYFGTIEDGKLTVDFGGLVYTFEKEEKEEKKDDKKANKGKTAEEVGYWTLHHTESDDPNEAMDEETVQMMKAFGLDIYLELREDGTGVFCLEEPFEITWGKGKVVFDDKSKFTYELKDDQLVCDLEGDIMVFVRGEGSAPAIGGGISGNEEELTDPMLKFWEGDWYGWWVIWTGSGEYSDMENDAWDAYAHIDVNADYTGTVTLWDVNTSRDEPIAIVDVTFKQGVGENGCMVSESGWFFDYEVQHADWNLDVAASMVRMFDNMIAIDSNYYDPEDSDSSYNYVFILRPWGMDWDDVDGVVAEGTYYDDMMPLEYSAWYLPLIEQGRGLPDCYEDGVNG